MMTLKDQDLRKREMKKTFPPVVLKKLKKQMKVETEATQGCKLIMIIIILHRITQFTVNKGNQYWKKREPEGILSLEKVKHQEIDINNKELILNSHQ